MNFEFFPCICQQLFDSFKCTVSLFKSIESCKDCKNQGLESIAKPLKEAGVGACGFENGDGEEAPIRSGSSFGSWGFVHE